MLIFVKNTYDCCKNPFTDPFTNPSPTTSTQEFRLKAEGYQLSRIKTFSLKAFSLSTFSLNS